MILCTCTSPFFPKFPASDRQSHSCLLSKCQKCVLKLTDARRPVVRFGGTDGSYHYNDTWAFDVNSRTWQELTCIGYIPVPREGHAAALVDDVIYVFGGRGVDGKDLGDLAAFKITSVSIRQ